MKTYRWFLIGVITLAAFVSGVLSSSLFTGTQACADIPMKSAIRPYTPTFVEWQEVYLKSHWTSQSDRGGFIGVVGPLFTGRGVRWQIRCRYYTKDSRHSLKAAGKAIHESWKALVEGLKVVDIPRWKARGFDVKFTDFDLDVKAMD